MSAIMQFRAVEKQYEGLGRGEVVVAQAKFTFCERQWEYLVLTCPEYTYQLALVELATGEVHGPYEYILPEYSVGDLLEAVQALAAEILDRK